MIDFTTTPIFCDADSGDSDGTTTTLGGAAITLGTAVGANGLHGWFRFDTSSIPLADTIVSCTFRANIQAGVTPTDAFRFWASEFGTGSPANADYNKSANNTFEGGATGTLRQEIGEIIAAQAYTLDDEVSIAVPSRFVRQGASALSDFEIRPDVAGVPAAGHTATVYGDGEVTKTTLIARLTGFALTDAELRTANAYRFTAVGAESFLAVGVEGTAGTPVKPNVLLELVSSSLDGTAQNIRSQALSRRRARPRKMAIGRSGAGGDISIELTPERWPVLLLGMLKKTVTNDLGLINSIQTYEHVFRVANTDEIYTFTGVQKEGPFYHVYPGLTVGMIDFSASLDQPITASVSFSGLEEWTYDENAGGEDGAALLDGAAAYDSDDNSILSFVGGAMEFDAIAESDGRCIQNCRIAMRQVVNEKRGFNRKRRIQGNYVGTVEVEVSFSAYYENEVQMRKYLGVSLNDFPFRPGQTIQTQGMTFSFAGTQGVDNQELLINIPRMVYDNISKPVTSEDAIMLNATASGVDDATIDGNIEITITNAQVGGFFDPLTDLLTVQPAEEIYQ